MGNRYWITGVQLGMLVGIDTPKGRREIAEKIMDEQYLCEAEEFKKLKYKEAKKTLSRLRSRN